MKGNSMEAWLQPKWHLNGDLPTNNGDRLQPCNLILYYMPFIERICQSTEIPTTFT